MISAQQRWLRYWPRNIRPAVFREPDRLTDYLTGEILAALADWFYLSPEWLNGGCIIHCIVRETGQQHRRYSAGLFQPARIWTLFSGMVFRLPVFIPENIAAFCPGRKRN